MSNIMLTPEYHENLLALLMNNDEVTLGNGITWRWMKPPYEREDDFALRVYVPMTLITEHPDIRMHVWQLMTDILETMLSETTNNDACRITITETSAHFDVHHPSDDALTTAATAEFGSVVVYDGRIDDYLS